MIDPYLMGKMDPECLQIYMDIATSCVRDEGKDRPTMCEVELILEKALELQESADAAKKDVNPGSDQYNYPDLEYTCSASLPQPDESISDWNSTTSAELSLGTTAQNPNGQWLITINYQNHISKDRDAPLHFKVRSKQNESTVAESFFALL